MQLFVPVCIAKEISENFWLCATRKFRKHLLPSAVHVNSSDPTFMTPETWQAHHFEADQGHLTFSGQVRPENTAVENEKMILFGLGNKSLTRINVATQSVGCLVSQQPVGVQNFRGQMGPESSHHRALQQFLLTAQ